MLGRNASRGDRGMHDLMVATIQSNRYSAVRVPTYAVSFPDNSDG